MLRERIRALFRVCPAFLFDHPAEITGAERDRLLDGRKLVVVEKDDAAATDQPPEKHEVDEYPIEAVIAVDEREVELTFLSATLIATSGCRSTRARWPWKRSVASRTQRCQCLDR